MPIFSHNFDYIALAFLIASMLGAAAIAISRRSTGGQMSRERAATYRLHAAHCSELAQRFSDRRQVSASWKWPLPGCGLLNWPMPNSPPPQ